MIDSIEEGEDCRCNNKQIEFKIYLAINSELKINSELVQKFDLIDSIKNHNFKRNIKFIKKEDSYEKICRYLQEFKYIILGGNIMSYFIVQQNKNDIEDVIISGFEYGLINKKALNSEIIQNLPIYKDKNKFYISNPLMKSEFISYTNMNYIEN